MNVFVSKSMTRMISMSASVSLCSFIRISSAMIMVQNGSQDKVHPYGSNGRSHSPNPRNPAQNTECKLARVS